MYECGMECLLEAKFEEAYFHSIGRADRAQHWSLCVRQAVAAHRAESEHRNNLFFEAKWARTVREEVAVGKRLVEENSMHDRLRTFMVSPSRMEDAISVSSDDDDLSKGAFESNPTVGGALLGEAVGGTTRRTGVCRVHRQLRYLTNRTNCESGGCQLAPHGSTGNW